MANKENSNLNNIKFESVVNSENDDNLIFGIKHLDEIISSHEQLNNVFFLPNFQRNYSWKKDQINKLTQSLMEDFSNRKLSFLGSVFLVRKKYNNGQKVVEHIIDGQQRLLTVIFIYYFFLLKDINNDITDSSKLLDKNKKDKLEYIEDFLKDLINHRNVNNVAERKQHNLLKDYLEELNKIDHLNFKEMVDKKIELFDNLESLKLIKSSIENRKSFDINNNYNNFLYFLEKCNFNFVSIDNWLYSQLLFNRMNDTSVSLTEWEKIRNILLINSDKDNLAQIEREIEEIEQSLIINISHKDVEFNKKYGEIKIEEIIELFLISISKNKVNKKNISNDILNYYKNKIRNDVRKYSKDEKYETEYHRISKCLLIDLKNFKKGLSQVMINKNKENSIISEFRDLQVLFRLNGYTQLSKSHLSIFFSFFVSPINKENGGFIKINKANSFKGNIKFQQLQQYNINIFFRKLFLMSRIVSLDSRLLGGKVWNPNNIEKRINTLFLNKVEDNKKEIKKTSTKTDNKKDNIARIFNKKFWLTNKSGEYNNELQTIISNLKSDDKFGYNSVLDKIINVNKTLENSKIIGEWNKKQISNFNKNYKFFYYLLYVFNSKANEKIINYDLSKLGKMNEDNNLSKKLIKENSDIEKNYLYSSYMFRALILEENNDFQFKTLKIDKKTNSFDYFFISKFSNYGNLEHLIQKNQDENYKRTDEKNYNKNTNFIPSYSNLMIIDKETNRSVNNFFNIALKFPYIEKDSFYKEYITNTSQKSLFEKYKGNELDNINFLTEREILIINSLVETFKKI